MFRILTRDQVDQAVGTLPDVSNLLSHGVQHQLALVLSSPTDPNPLDHLPAHSGHEQVSLPCWKAIAGVKQNIRDTNRRHPEEARRLHAFAKWLLANDLATVFAPITDDRPSIVRAPLNDVDLVSTHRPMLACPDFARF